MPFRLCCRRHVLTLVLTVGLAWPAVADDPFVIATGDNYPPFTGRTLDGGGIATRLVVAAFEKSGAAIDAVRWMPWKRNLEQARRGAIDATYPWIASKDRRRLFHYSAPFLPVDEYVWMRNDAQVADPKTVDDLDGLRLCLPLAYAVPARVAAPVADGRIWRTSPREMDLCFRMLATERVDFVISNLREAQQSIEESGIERSSFHKTQLLLARNYHHLIAAKSHAGANAVIQAFNAGLDAMTADGTLDALLSGTEWDPAFGDR